MKVYLAARFSRKPEMQLKAQVLREEGIEVSSNWLDEIAGPNATLSDFPDEYFVMAAQTDLTDIDGSDALLFFSEDPLEPHVRGGRHVEYGYALAKGIPIIVIGPKENIFHFIDRVLVVKTFADAVGVLKQLAEIEEEMRN